MSIKLKAQDSDFATLKEKYKSLVEKERRPLKYLHEEGSLTAIRFTGTYTGKTNCQGFKFVQNIKLYTIKEIVPKYYESRYYKFQYFASLGHAYVDPDCIAIELKENIVIGFAYADSYTRRKDGSMSYNLSSIPKPLFYQYKALQFTVVFSGHSSIESRLVLLELMYGILVSLFESIDSAKGLQVLAIQKLNPSILDFVFDSIAICRFNLDQQLSKPNKKNKDKKKKGFGS